MNVIITGASNGLGRSLARLYATPGVRLGLTGRDRDRLDGVARECEAKGASVESVSLDVRDREQLIAWLERFDEAHPVDLLIANAGVMHAARKAAPVEPREVIKEILDVNFNGVIDTANPLLERMRSRGRGSVAIISSLSAYHGTPRFPAYAASKAALRSYYEAVRGQYARAGVQISIVCPGFIRTDMTEKLQMPALLLLDVDKAAAKIKKGIEKNKGEISFPWYLRLGLASLRLIPARLGDWIMLKFFGM